MKDRSVQDGSVVIMVRVTTRSSRPGISGSFREGFTVRLKSPPVEGKANRELIRMLTKRFRIRQKDVQILAGKSSRDKRVCLSGTDKTSVEQMTFDL